MTLKNYCIAMKYISNPLAIHKRLLYYIMVMKNKKKHKIVGMI